MVILFYTALLVNERRQSIMQFLAIEDPWKTHGKRKTHKRQAEGRQKAAGRTGKKKTEQKRCEKRDDGKSNKEIRKTELSHGRSEYLIRHLRHLCLMDKKLRAKAFSIFRCGYRISIKRVCLSVGPLVCRSVGPMVHWSLGNAVMQ